MDDAKDGDKLAWIEAKRRDVAARPNDAEAWFELGDAISSLLFPIDEEGIEPGGRPEVASNPQFGEMLSAFRRAALIDPTESASEWNAAIALDRAGEFAAAAESYLNAARRAAIAGPIGGNDIAVTLYNAAESWERAGRRDEAMLALEAAEDAMDTSVPGSQLARWIAVMRSELNADE